MNFSVMYLSDSHIYYLKDKTSEIIEFILPKNIIRYGKVYNLKGFSKYFKKMLSENNLTKVVSNGNLKIITNELFFPLDKIFLKELCLELNYKHIDFINESNIFSDYKNKVYVNYNDDYSFIYFNERNFVNTIVITNCEESKLLNFLKLKFPNNYYYFFGSSQASFTNSNIYYFQNQKTFLIRFVYDLKSL